MTRFLLDTSAILTLRDDEPGADRVAALLRGPDSSCFACFMTRMEGLYRVCNGKIKDSHHSPAVSVLPGTRILSRGWCA